VKHKNVFESTITAGQGLIFALRHQRSIRTIAIIAVLVTALSPFLKLTAAEYMILTITISLVFITELINSGLEYAIDLVTEDYHDLAKAAKDVGAAAVFLACLNSVIVGVIWLVGRLGWLQRGF
jgi:diacylglycerol kinase (ATP)